MKMHMNTRKPLAVAIALASLTGFQSMAGADELMLEEVIVTAQKRAQSLQDVAISINAVSGETIKDFNISSLETLAGSVPNLKISKTGITNQIGMRGVFSGTNKGFEQSVAMYVDNVYYGRGQLIQLPLVDLERVEVLRGPQPTLFGKNAIAGAISLTAARPSDEFEASISTLYEFEHEERKTVGIVSGPITDQLAGRLVVSHREMDGWMSNTNLGDRKEPNSQQTYVRGLLEWDNGSDLRVSVKAETAEFDTVGRSLENHSPVGIYSAVFTGPLAVDADENYGREDDGQESNNKVDTLVVGVDYDFNDYTLTSTSAYLTYNTRELIDVDYTALNLFDGTNQGEDYKQFSQELRIASPTVGNFDYVAGLYYQKSELEAFDEAFFGPTFGANPAYVPVVGGRWKRDFEQDAEVWSAFAQVNWHMTDQLTLTVGARYSDEDKDAERVLALHGEETSGIPANALFPGSPAFGPQAGFVAALSQLKIYGHEIAGKRNESQFDPLINLQYDLNDAVMLYASYTEGSKGGGFDLRSNNVPGAAVNPGSFEFEDEHATSYELGAKFGFDRGEINVAAFLTEYEDLQITQFDGTVGFNVQNAAEAEIKGIELDGRLLLAENLMLTGSLAFLDFEYKDFDVAQCAPAISNPNQTASSTVAGLCNISGERAASTPELSGHLSLQYEHSVSDWAFLSYAINMEYSDDYNASSTMDPNTRQDSFTKWGARIALASNADTWQLALIGHNLTNERIMTVSSTLPLSTTLTGGAGTAYYGIYERPRSLAMELSYNF